MNKQGWLTVLVIAIFLAGAISLLIWNESHLAIIPSTPSTPNDIYTLSDIATHTEAASCWTSIDGSVYDLTEFIEEHPGGSKAILVICGFDGTGSFNSMPAAVMPVVRMTLAKYKIGTLAE